MNFYYLEIIHILHPRYQPKIVGHILIFKQKNNCVCIHDIMRLTVMKMKMKVKNKSHRYDIIDVSLEDTKYSKYKVN